MILAVARSITIENASLRSGGWQIGVGSDLRGKTLAVLGLGNVGGPVAAIGKAFGMRVIAWSPNLTREKAEPLGAQLVSKDDLFREADFLTVHLVLSAKTRGVVGESELALMKPSSHLINTSRGPLIEETSLIRALEEKQIAGFDVDVFEHETMHDVVAASLPVAYLTAQITLTVAGFKPGMTVLAPAIGGSVGNATYQLAPAQSAGRVISTAGS